ncbi:MAG: hypothetical protein KAV40_01325 [Thermoplasmatales archaeon]|nr:hypothetical protein [Thermoplasmatales archaeon]
MNKLLTVKGLEYLTYASLIAIGWGLMSLIIFLNYYLNNSFIQMQFWWAGLYLFLYVLGGVLFIIGLYKMWKGRHEFGKQHISNLEKTLWFIIIILAISALTSGPFTMLGYFYMITVTIPFFLLTLMILVIPLYLIKTLSTPWVKNMLIVGVSFFVVLYLISTTMQYVLGLNYRNVSLRTLLILSDLIPYILLFIAYYKTLIHVRNKGIKTV